MSPEAFVDLLAEQLQVAGVVVGSNYRFGYRAAGTAQLLQQLGPARGMQVRVHDIVGSAAAPAAVPADGGGEQQGRQQQQGQLETPPTQRQQDRQQDQHLQHLEQRQAQGAVVDRQEAQEAVSSSRVRHALAAGDMADAAMCLGRPYRLVASLADAASSAEVDGDAALRLPSTALLNQPPRCGHYRVHAAVTGSDTLHQLLPAWQALLAIDEAGLSLHSSSGSDGSGSDQLDPLQLPAGSQHLTLDFM